MYGNILSDPTLPLQDRIAFAARFLPDAELEQFVKDRAIEGVRRGALEGLLLTGFGQSGLNLLQSYLDTTGDLQTVALLCAQIPSNNNNGNRLATEWISHYQTLLNRWKLWEERAIFDVERMELQRQYREKREKTENPLSPSQNDSPAPPSLYVRCNYCGVSLSLASMLRLGTSHANWLTRAKPVLTCCPGCKKPLPHCALCLLPFGSLNPYFELASRRSRVKNDAEDLVKSSTSTASTVSELSCIPFVEWITWCQSCRHGFHAHHAAEWFALHSVCPVTDCTCISISISINKHQHQHQHQH